MTTEIELKTTRNIPDYLIKKSFIINEKLSLHIFTHEVSKTDVIAIDHFLHKDMVFLTKDSFKKIANILKKDKIIK